MVFAVWMVPYLLSIVTVQVYKGMLAKWGAKAGRGQLAEGLLPSGVEVKSCSLLGI